MLRANLKAGFVLSLLALSACAGKTPPVGGDPQLTVLPADAFPAPDPTDLTSSSTAYYVGPFDKLTIDVYGIEELSNRAVTVDANGRISFPLVGALDVAGKTTDEVAALLEAKLKQSYVRDPQVFVTLVQTGSQLLTLDGDVSKPGLYPVVGKLTLIRAIAMAGGTSEFAKLQDVMVFRTVKDRKLVAVYNLGAIRRGAYADPAIYANDVIVVGDNAAKRFLGRALQTLPLLTTPLYLYNTVKK